MTDDISCASMGVRSFGEIKDCFERISVSGDDFFYVQRLRLVEALTFEEAREYLNEEMLEDPSIEQRWAEKNARTPAQAIEAYLPFAVVKALNHRGLSAQRSVDHISALTWLMGDDPHRQYEHDTSYPQYGVPKLRKAAELAGVSWPPADRSAEVQEVLRRMSVGMRCTEGCKAGC